MRRTVNRITTHRDRHNVAYWRFHYSDGSGYALLSEKYTRGDFMERNGGWLEWLRRFSTGISIDIPEMEIVLQRGKTSELVQDFTMRGVPGEDVVVIPKKQGRLI